MSSTFPSTPADHAWARETIPWLVNGTLSQGDECRLREHVEVCDECRSDLRLEEQFARHLAVRPTVDYAPQASLARMMQRLDRPAMFSPRRWFSNRRGMGGERRRGAATFVIAAQAAALLVLALALSWAAWKPEPTYVLAGAQVPRLPHLQVIFEDKAGAGEILATVARVNGRVIGGPSSAGVYLVAIEGGGDALNTAAHALQQDARVRFVAVVQAP